MGRRFESCRKRLKRISMNKSLLKKVGYFCFLAGLFILPSALFFSSILLFFSASIGCFICEQNYFKSNWNKSFFVCGLLILLSSLTHSLNLTHTYKDLLDPKLSFIGTLNWLPFFWLFWGFQPYLNSRQKRKRSAIILVAATFPVLFSGFGQYFFDWTGPLKTLSGLIIWYQRPIDKHGLTGLFNNQNYAGAWLSLIWPFCIALVLEKSNLFLKKYLSLIFLIAVGLATILTNSRNSWASIIGSIPLVVGPSSFLWFLPSVLFIASILVITIYQPFSGELQNIFREIIPQKIWLEFAAEGIGNLKVTRFEIFISALNISKVNPFFGLGAGSFPVIYELQQNLWRGHPHNILLELAISYGYPVTILFVSSVITLLIMSAKLVFNKKNQSNELIYFERAWWTSIFSFCFTQLFDIQYFDARLSITSWILLCGLKLMLDENRAKTKFDYDKVK